MHTDIHGLFPAKIRAKREKAVVLSHTGVEPGKER